MIAAVDKLKSALWHLPELLIIYFSPASQQIGVVILAIMADTIAGIWAARKVNEHISSRRLADVLLKLLLYIILILLFFHLDQMMHWEEPKGTLSLVTLALLGVELKSVDEKFVKATGKGVLKGVIAVLKRK